MKLFTAETLMTPGDCLEGLWKRVPGYARWAFFSAVILGLATHLFMFTNKFINHDDLDQMFQIHYGAASGRWLLPAAARLDGEFSVPWLIGVLGVLCLAGAACLTVSLLRIRTPLGCVLTAGLMVSFPVVASTFAYMFTADMYFLSLLLAAFGAWAAVRWGWRGSAGGVLAITLSLGLYQAYFPVAAVLMVGALLFEVLDGEKSCKALFLKGLRLVGTLAAGLAAYLVVVRLTTRESGLVDYQGLDHMGLPPLERLPELIGQAYGKYVTVFLGNEPDWTFGVLRFVLPVSALGGAALLALVLRRRRLGADRTTLAVVLAVLYPLAGNLIFLLAYDGTIHDLMIYGLIYVPILLIALVEYAQTALQKQGELIAHRLVSWIVALTLAPVAWGYAITDNNMYLRAELAMRQCEAYSNRLLERIEACEGFEAWRGVILVGSNVWTWDLNVTPALDSVDTSGIMNLSGLRTTYSYGLFLRNFLGFPAPVYCGDSEEAKAAAELEEVKKMPLYPSAGSVRLVRYEPTGKDVIVVKLAEPEKDPPA